MGNRDYVIVTAARNEEATIERTIQSVIAQTVLPRKWVIVSDGSTDRTDEIVGKYAAVYGFIELIRREPPAGRNFASQVYAQMAGVKKLRGIDYEFIGMLDADISLGADYYERVIDKFRQNSALGIAGGLLSDVTGGKVIKRIYSPWSVGGMIQLFRRRCFEDIGGYRPLKMGEQDTVAQVIARVHGWQVRTFPDIGGLHLRRAGTADRNILMAGFNLGLRDHSIGNHPLYELAICIRRLKERPIVAVALFRAVGFLWAYLSRQERQVGKEIIDYARKEQMQRLRSYF